MTVGTGSTPAASDAGASESGRSIPSPPRDDVSSAVIMSPVVFNNRPLSTESDRHVADHRQKDGQGANENQDEAKCMKVDAEDYWTGLYGEVQKGTNSNGDVSTGHER
jgi:hypothetical protein